MHLTGGYYNNNVVFISHITFLLLFLFPKLLRRKAGHYLLQEKANLHQTRWMIIQKRSSEQWLRRTSQLVRKQCSSALPHVIIHAPKK